MILYHMRAKLAGTVLIMLSAVLLLFSRAGIRAYASVPEGAGDAAGQGKTLRVTLPYTAKTGGTDDAYKALYVVGGYHSIDSGAPAWGTSNYADIRLVGDRMGTLDVKYADGTVDKIPLVFGYTMWFYNNWRETASPFKGSGEDSVLTAKLRSALMLKGAFEGENRCVFKIQLRDQAVKSIKITDEPSKNGEPVFECGFLSNASGNENESLSYKGFSFNTGDAFFNTHTINSADPFPDTVKDSLDALRHALYTFEPDYKGAEPFVYPSGYEGPEITFSGNEFANMAGGIIYTNLVNLESRTDDDGFMHTSYKGAPSWRYDGFGVWVESADSYYDSFYSRDGGRGIMSLLLYGQTGKALAAAGFANAQMMYFPENKLTLGGKEIPGHYTVVVNKPLHYSKVLVPEANWPTSYTKAAFGDEFQNLGNQETDGHGLMMLANYSAWRNSGRDSAWVDSNWAYIKEACDWISWCFENSSLSFAKNGLLYAESEAGMQKYTLYCNLPCYLGLKGYAEMAQAAGHAEEAAEWSRMADELRAAIIDRLSNKKGWVSSRYGFYHDPALTMMADFYGFDIADMDSEMAALSALSYEADTGSSGKSGWFGAAGIGYDHSMLTQNALLSDHMSDASKLVENLCRISYAPGLPEPYMVPEGVSVDRENGIIRRQGDLGNLVQLAEALKCCSIVTGLSPVNGNTLKIMPRLPENWSVSVKALPVTGDGSGFANMKISYPSGGVQTAQIKLTGTDGIDTVKLRLGPFPAGIAFIAAQVNGSNTQCEMADSGDSTWAWVDLGAPSDNELRVALIYGSNTDNIPAWPDDWGELDTSTPERAHKTPEKGADDIRRYGNILKILIPAAAVLAATGAIIAVMILRKRGKTHDKMDRPQN
ncbi:MAG: hypothetical protein J6Y21_08430 [Clostridia bacterium]|nr:hypothetical protein [Clostridia bacterium]